MFYETRVLTGRDYTLRRFATEVLGGSVEPVMLGCIEKGTLQITVTQVDLGAGRIGESYIYD